MIDLDDGVRLVLEAPTVLAEVTQMQRFSAPWYLDVNLLSASIAAMSTTRLWDEGHRHGKAAEKF